MTNRLLTFVFISYLFTTAVYSKAFPPGAQEVPSEVKVKLTRMHNLDPSILDAFRNLNYEVDEISETEVYVKMPFEEFVKGVVFAEIGRESNNENVLKAQAIVARSYIAAVDLRRSKEEVGRTTYDFTDNHKGVNPSGQEFRAYVSAMREYNSSLGTYVDGVFQRI